MRTAEKAISPELNKPAQAPLAPKMNVSPYAHTREGKPANEQAGKILDAHERRKRCGKNIFIFLITSILDLKLNTPRYINVSTKEVGLNIENVQREIGALKTN